jgi:hypothetical protein
MKIFKSIQHGKGDVTGLDNDSGTSGQFGTYLADVQPARLDSKYMCIGAQQSESGNRNSPSSIKGNVFVTFFKARAA